PVCDGLQLRRDDVLLLDELRVRFALLRGFRVPEVEGPHVKLEDLRHRGRHRSERRGQRRILRQSLATCLSVVHVRLLQAGWSRRRTRGSITSAREISSSRRSPPESTRASWWRRFASRGYFCKTCSAACFASSGRAMRYPPIQRFSSTVMSGNTELSWRM